MVFHILSFEGPDAYARAGGLASRVEGLALSLLSTVSRRTFGSSEIPKRPVKSFGGACISIAGVNGSVAKRPPVFMLQRNGNAMSMPAS